MKIKNLNPYLTPYTKTNLKQMRDLNVKTKMIKLLELKGDYLHDLGVDKEFFF